jgi:hypothetical protein
METGGILEYEGRGGWKGVVLGVFRRGHQLHALAVIVILTGRPSGEREWRGPVLRLEIKVGCRGPGRTSVLSAVKARKSSQDQGNGTMGS